VTLSEALEHKDFLQRTIETLKARLSEESYDISSLAEDLDKIGQLINQAVRLDKRINEAYATLLVTETESISDILFEIDGFQMRSNLLGIVIGNVLRDRYLGKDNLNLDIAFLIDTKVKYEIARDELKQKVREFCRQVELP